MRTITQPEIVEAWETMSSLSDNDSKRLIDQMQKEQPAILAYLVAMEENTDDEDAGWLLELGCFVFYAMSQKNKQLKAVSHEDIDAREEQNALLLEKLDESSEQAWLKAINELVVKHNQGPLLAGVLELLFSDEVDESSASGERIGTGLLALKAVVECLDQ